MFHIKWDKEINGVLLGSSFEENERISPPRPVFFEELDLLGFDKYWEYPRSEFPLLWALGRGYYFKGNLVAQAKGGNIFESPEIIITDLGKNLELEPIDIDNVVEKNKHFLSILENEALDFISDVYKKYKKKGYVFSVSFSGGKDSQVILDLVTRIIPPDELIVIFSDTTMEIFYTYECVEATKKQYEKKYPGLKFLIAKPPKPAIEFWKEFGPPSRIHRWCCTVTKTAPFNKLVKELISKSKNKKNKIIVFDGVRADESNQRANYARIASGVKHSNIINVEVIRDWSTLEVFVYMFFRNLLFNNAYKFGLGRVGCSICPFGSPFNEYVINRIASDECKKFITIIEEYVKNLKAINSENNLKFISDGKWKGRSSSNGLKKDNYIKINRNNSDLIITITNPIENIFEWFKVLGNFWLKESNQEITGGIKIKDKEVNFYFRELGNSYSIAFKNIEDINIINKLEKIAYKTTFCLHCGGCDVECPTNALITVPKVKINIELCINCGNCLSFTTKGCISAKSFANIFGGRKTMGKIKNFGRYFKFGLRQEWIDDFFNRDNYIQENFLGPKQLEAFIRWNIDAEMLSKDKNLTSTYHSLKKINQNNKNIIWEIILVNLFYGSNIINWYLNSFKWGEYLSKKQMLEIAIDEFAGSEGTINNGLLALFNTFENSPLGNELNIGNVEVIKRERYINKLGTDNIHPFVVAYSLYKAAENIGRKDFTVAELYSEEFEGGPYKIFGISRDKLERILRGLQEDKDKILRADLKADLDNIFLRDDLNSIDILKILSERL